LTCVVRDCCKGLCEQQIDRTCNELRGRNVPYIESTHVEQFLSDHKVPWLWICQMCGLGERRHRRQKRNSAISDEEVKENGQETPHGTIDSMIQNSQDRVTA
jgi:hypothetical protein